MNIVSKRKIIISLLLIVMIITAINPVFANVAKEQEVRPTPIITFFREAFARAKSFKNMILSFFKNIFEKFKILPFFKRFLKPDVIDEYKPTAEDIKFSFDFLKKENEEKNMIYSPLSIKYALHMLNEGAGGNTKTQIQKVIGNTSLPEYDDIENTLSFANVVYIKDEYSKDIKESFKNNLANNYKAEVKYDAFKDAHNINSWIEDKTLGQINNLLQDEEVNGPDSVMALINALAIDMKWKNEFDVEDTHGGIFYLNNGNTMTATMMTNKTNDESTSYYKDDNLTAVSMDLEKYGDQQMEFIAIMPNENLSKYIENFTENDLKNVTNKFISASKTKNGLKIYIPKFSFDYELKLKEDLQALGITDAFEKKVADFSNMSNEIPLYVSKAKHKANIDFSEKGIKAAAVTVFIIDKNCMIEQEEIVKIDKPFMYIIRDKKTNEIWFAGTVYEPNSWENDKEDYKSK